MKDKNISDVAKGNIKKRFTKTAWVYFLSILSGLLFGITIIIFKKAGSDIPSTVVILGTLLFVLFLYVLTWYWFKSMDEFEQKSFNEAGNLAFHFGFLAFPWFILQELGVLPSLEAIYMLLAMSVVFILYYYIKKLF